MCKAVMSVVGLGPKAPILAPPLEELPPLPDAPPAAPPPVPTPLAPAAAPSQATTVQERMTEVGTEASAEERLRAGRARGRASTLLTGGQGVTDAPVLSRPMAGAGARALLG
jgi:hypothetical protein